MMKTDSSWLLGKLFILIIQKTVNISTKEDILYLVCEAIHAEMQQAVTEALACAQEGTQALEVMIRDYLQVCHRMSDHILLVYQETQSLPSKWRRLVLENEIHITGLFTNALAEMVVRGDLPDLDARTLDLLAHNISVLGHMWAFRRWFLACHYTIEEYTHLQTAFILGQSRRLAAGAGGPHIRRLDTGL